MQNILLRTLQILIIWLAVLLVGFAGLSLWQRTHPPTPRTTTTGAALIGGPFQLIDEEGRVVSDETFKGKWMMVYFGYTFCPDACPTALSDMAAALDKLGDDASHVAALLITVDPERDTQTVLHDYVKSFDPRIHGLTGSLDAVDGAAKAYRAYYQRHEAGPDGRYAVDHSSIIYVMGPDGKFVTNFSHETGGDRMAEVMHDLITHS